MSGHSKWSTIKHKKAKADAERGKAFTKVIKELTIAARMGGGDPNANPRLRTAILAAKAVNMPNDNIDRAIKKGTGELEGITYEDTTYEGYGPGGAALLVEVTTDNKNRTVSEIRHIFSRNGGNMAESGAVAWMFHKKGLILIDRSASDEDTLMTAVLDAGAEDMKTDEETYEVTTQLADFETVKKAVENLGVKASLAEISMVPQTTVVVKGKDAQQLLKLTETLEEHDDVRKVYSNFNIPQEELEALAEEL
jgi:YebC/PmpR family DNA-binding regulatory protein